MVFTVKQALKRKARLAARGDEAEPRRGSARSGAASLRGLRAACFLAELSGLQSTGVGAGRACLEDHTKQEGCASWP